MGESVQPGLAIAFTQRGLDAEIHPVAKIQLTPGAGGCSASPVASITLRPPAKARMRARVTRFITVVRRVFLQDPQYRTISRLRSARAIIIPSKGMSPGGGT